MLRKLGFVVFMAGSFLLLMNSSTYAQRATRINFHRGASSASVSGTLGPRASRTYVLRARENQDIHAVVSGKNVQLDNGNVTMSYSTPSGNNYIKVMNRGKTSTRYTLTVSIQ